MWPEKFWHFFRHCADTFIHSLGNTWLGLAINIAFAVGTIAATLFLVHRKHGRDAMLTKWTNESKMAAKVGLICASFLYVPLALFSIGKAVYEDHEGLVQVSKGQRSAIARMQAEPLTANIHQVSTEGKRATFVYLANKVIVPAVVTVHCDGPIAEVQASIVDTKIMIARAAWQLPDDPKTWMVGDRFSGMDADVPDANFLYLARGC